MTQQSKHPFIQWIDDVEEELGWTDNKWATKAKISASVLSRARQQGVIPKWEACKALADGAKKSPITAFRRAGLLPPGPDDELSFEDWQHLLAQMTPEERDELKEIGVMKIDRRKKEKSLKTLKPKKAG